MWITWSSVNNRVGDFLLQSVAGFADGRTDGSQTVVVESEKREKSWCIPIEDDLFLFSFLSPNYACDHFLFLTLWSDVMSQSARSGLWSGFDLFIGVV